MQAVHERGKQKSGSCLQYENVYIWISKVLEKLSACRFFFYCLYEPLGLSSLVTYYYIFYIYLFTPNVILTY